MKKLLYVKPALFLPNSITIVGSSISILKNKNGKEIDNSKFIVRFNLATTRGFQKYTGNVTSLMVINNVVYKELKFKKIKKKMNNFLVISPNKEKKYRSDSKICFFEKKIFQYFLALKFISYKDIFFKLIKILIKKNFSVGFCFILLCISSKIKIKIFGFDLEENMYKRKHYYKKLSIGNVHNLTLEHDVLKKLKYHKLVNFIK